MHNPIATSNPKQWTKKWTGPGPRILTLSNPKTQKTKDPTIWTAVVHLAPSNLASGPLFPGLNLCPQSAHCRSVCLNTAGRGGIGAGSIKQIQDATKTNSVQQARIRKTRQLFSDPDTFLHALFHDCLQHVRRCIKADMRPAFRLNATSDLDWGPFRHALASHIAEHYPDCAPPIFYDYTKRLVLFAAYQAAPLPTDHQHHVTWSYDPGHKGADATAQQVLQAGHTAAVCFDLPKSASLPATFLGFPVIDGDKHDQRFLDSKSVVVGLRAKGRARGSKFAVKVEG